MSIENFHKSTASELTSLKDKVRNLIDHWGEDGRYKEAILKTIIERFLPPKFIIVNGFVIKRNPDNWKEHIASNQIDLMIVDNSYPFVFKSGDFAIVTPDAVVAIIEVKANIENQGIKDVIEKSHENGAFIITGKENYRRSIFNGIFSFEGCEKMKVDTFKNNYIEASEEASKHPYFQYFCVDHICYNQNWFLKFWEQEYADAKKETCYLYNIPDLSFSFFISSLLDHIASDSIKNNSSIWFHVNDDFKVVTKFRFPK